MSFVEAHEVVLVVNRLAVACHHEALDVVADISSRWKLWLRP